MKQFEKAVYWFRRDLRISDNPAWEAAKRRSKEIIPLYIHDESEDELNELGLPRMGDIRRQFLYESLQDLDLQLKEDGGALWFAQGKTRAILEKMVQSEGVEAVFCGSAATFEERELERELEKSLPHFQAHWQHTLYDLEDLPFPIEKVPFVFTDMRKKLEKYGSVRELKEDHNKGEISKALDSYKLPSQAELGWPEQQMDERAVLPFQGGRTSAWRRLEEYFWSGDHLREYKETRNGLLGANYSSKFSAWLALGCISPVEIYREVKRYEEDRVSNSSTYWLIFELIWRDFFQFTTLSEGGKFFRVVREASWEVKGKFEDWRLGQCGQDFVDANMRELLQTGYMSNRGRQNVASYLVHDLGQAWYLGARWFETQLIDYDPASNYGNWTYVAGVGHDPRKDRYFNVEKQAANYDADGAYRAHWNPR